VLYIKAGAANMAGAWFIHRPVRSLYRPGLRIKSFWEDFHNGETEKCSLIYINS